MEDESLIGGEAPAETPSEAGEYLPPEPRVLTVLMVLLGFCLLFSFLGVLLFRGIALLAGWDPALLYGTLAPDAGPAERWQMRILLGISHLTTFILAGWVTVRLFYPPSTKALEYLGARVWPGARWVMAGVSLIVVSLPLVLFLYQVNKALPLPESWRLMEDQTNDVIKGLLRMDTLFELIANLTLIALLPAVGEELVFRGVLQQQLLRGMTKATPWAALVLTAAIFSFIHFQFEGFLPRMFLGMLLGWLYWRSGNFWVPAMAHFVNNATQVFGQFLYSRDLSSIDMEQDVEVPWYAAVLSAVLMIGVVRWISTMTTNNR